MDVVKVADGCGDLSVVTIGTLSACGIADEPILETIDANNLMKFAPGHRIDEFGKLIKPQELSEPGSLGSAHAHGLA